MIVKSESGLWICIAEVEPISTYVDFGEREFLVADERGYEYLLYKMAEDFLFTSGGKILDNRLKLNQVQKISVLNLFFLIYVVCLFIYHPILAWKRR